MDNYGIRKVLIVTRGFPTARVQIIEISATVLFRGYAVDDMFILTRATKCNAGLIPDQQRNFNDREFFFFDWIFVAVLFCNLAN